MVCNLSSIREIDFYGKEPEFYLKGKPQIKTVVGTIFTFLYMVIYITYFIYKLIRMFVRSDLAFYDSDSEGSETLSMHLTKDNFYFTFTFINALTGEPFLDESVFYPIASFNEEEIIEMKPCTIDKVGSKYSDLYDDTQLDKNYCLEKLNHTIIAYHDYFYIAILPCKNDSENNFHCKPKEVIDEYLNGGNIIIRLEDIIVTPKNYSYPVKQRLTDIYSYIFKSVGQYFYIELQLVNIETNTNMIGLDFFQEDRSEFYIRYDRVSTLPTPGYNLDEEDNYYPICEIEIQLKDTFFSEKRQYTQLFDVLGEVGGFMEIISSFFGLICSFIVDIFYENSITNNLFSFDLKKKLISIKKIDNSFKYKFQKNDEQQNEEKNNQLNLNLNSHRRSSKNKKKIVIDKLINESNINNNSEAKLNEKQQNIMVDNINKNEKNKRSKRKSIERSNSDKSIKLVNMKRRLSRKFSKENNKSFINHVDMNNFCVHFGFCCMRKKKNLQNILMDEAMDLITEKLDIINIFRTMCLNEEIQFKYEFNIDIIQMSEDCVNALKNINIT